MGESEFRYEGVSAATGTLIRLRNPSPRLPYRNKPRLAVETVRVGCERFAGRLTKIESRIEACNIFSGHIPAEPCAVIGAAQS